MNDLILVRTSDDPSELIDHKIYMASKGVHNTIIKGNVLYVEDTNERYEGMDDWFFSYEDTIHSGFKPRMIKPNVTIINTEQRLEEFVSTLSCLKNTYTAWDTETTGLSAQQDGLVGIGVCWGNDGNSCAYIPVGHWVGDNLPLDMVRKALNPFLSNPKKKKVLHNAKFDLKFLKTNNFEFDGLYFDTIIGHWLLHTKTGYSHAIEQVVKEYISVGFPIPTYDDLIKQLPAKLKHKNIGDIDPEQVGFYCGIDCLSTWMLFPILKQKLEFEPLLKKIFYDIEMPIIEILRDMELVGLKLDEEWYSRKRENLIFELEEIKVLASSFKEGINLGSTKQLQDYLFNECKISTKGLKKNLTGICLDEKELKKLRGKHPIVAYVQSYRSASKLLSTYVEGIWDRRDTTTNLLHASFNQIGTVTGRLSCENPNGQNFPKFMRRGIISRPGHVFLSIDWSGCEYRILTHFSECKEMIHQYMNGGDAHTAVCKLFFPERNPKEEWRNGRNYRYFGKQINFSIVYGQSPIATAESTGLSLQEVLRNAALYWEFLPEVKEFRNKVIKTVIAEGYSETIMGRKRRYDIHSKFYKNQRGKPWELIDLLPSDENDPRDAETFRQAFNAVMQGSNADLMKLALFKVHHFLLGSGFKTRLLLTIHDEFVFEVPHEELPYVIKPISSIMENIVELIIPLEVEYKIGENWSFK